MATKQAAVAGPVERGVGPYTELTALERFKECDGHEAPNALERLRFFCSLAMTGQDWLDVEPFFDDLETLLPAA